MKRVLITGASGFLGRHCVPLLAESACDVYAVIGSREIAVPEGVRVQRLNLHDRDAVTTCIAALRPTHLLHLAWNATPGEFWTAPDNLDWVGSSLHLLRAFAEHGGSRAVMAGTCAEYADSHAALHETNSPCQPQTLYGASKHGLRIVAEAFANRVGVSFAWARLFGLFGPYEHSQRVVAGTVRQLLAGSPVRCTSGEQERDFLHVADAAHALTRLIASSLEGPLNIASGQAVTISRLVESLAEMVGGASPVEFGARSRSPSDPARVVADIGRLRTELAWQPSRTLIEGLADAVAWWRNKEADHARAA